MSGATTDVDAIVVGAGVAGLYQLHRLRSLGMSVRVFEAGNDVGGTWYWNRYPGARFDSESYSYGYSFSDELVEDWRWSEHFAAQPETLRYLQHVADRFDLRRDITFGVRVVAAAWDDGTRSWTVTLGDGSTHRSRFLILAIGILSVPRRPDIAGLDDFEGTCLHTGEWPQDPVDTAGRRVGVIGTGASAVQLITELAKTVGHFASSSAPHRGVRPWVTARSTRTRNTTSRRMPMRSSSAAVPPSAASSTTPTGARPWKCPPRSGPRCTKSSTHSPGSRSGWATSETFS